MQRIAESLPPPRHKRSTDEVFSEPQRLHKVLASCGFGSRRAMEEMILAGRITVNRMPAEVGQKVGPGDEVRINGEVVKVRFSEPSARILIYHKPAGELVTRDDPQGRPTVFEKLPSAGSGRWINIGRLDYNTEGLLLFTNSGELANRLMHPRYEVEREYAVRVMGRLTDEQMQQLTTGIQLEDGPARCDRVGDGGGDEDGANHWYHVVLKEGRNREVRRIFEALGIMVSRLIRTRFGALAMPTHLKRAQLTELEPSEVAAIVASAGLRPEHARSTPRQHSRDPRAGANKPSHGSGKRPLGKGHKTRPHGGQGPRAPFGVQDRASRDASASEPAAERSTSESSPRPSGHQHPGKGRAWKHRGVAKQGDAAGPRPPRKDAPHQPPKPHAQGPRPPRVRHNFDEVQPQSNANASPFGRATLTVSGSPHGNHAGESGPRQRSGPRAHRAKGNGHARGQTKPFDDRRDSGEPVYKAPARAVTQTQIRSKRTRTVVQADLVADANGSAALRRLLNDDKS